MNVRTPAQARFVDVLTGIQRALARDLTERFGEEDATLDQWRALAALVDADTGLSMGELGEAIQLPAASLTRLVDGLADAALAYRRPSAEDGRRVSVQVSALGRRKLARLDAIAAAHMASFDAPTRAAVRATQAALTDLAATLG